MAVVRLRADSITDWASFHVACKEAFGFPDFYGENLDAFIDCLTYIDEGDGMSNIILADGENLFIEIFDSPELRATNPEILEGLDGSVRSLNERFTEAGKAERIFVVLK